MTVSKKHYLWIALALAAFAVWWFVWMTMLPLAGAGVIRVQVPRGASAREVSHILASEHVVRSAFGFQLLARITRKSDDLKPGAYEFKPPMTPRAVLNKIAKGDVCAQWITFPEGFTVRQIAERLAAGKVCDGNQFFIQAQHGQSFTTDFPLPAGMLEGYLFPDTYLFPNGASGEETVREMLDCFNRRVAEPLADDIRTSGMSLHEILTLASLIEREARVPKDRPLVSAVLRNRLKKNMRLECDATVLYALGRHKNRVLYSDLEADSLYNTYRHAGLPPGPICNPGLASIKAALHPAQVDYLFYVARPDGSHIFTRTFEEHQKARQIARRGAG